jgi:hypothetical protein
VDVRRAFWIGAAGLLSVAALIAIATVLGGDFGETEGKFFATIATGFVSGSTVLAAIACLQRGQARPVALGGVVLAAAGSLLWIEQVWAEHDSETYWKLLGLVAVWSVFTLVVTTLRLMTSAPRLLGTLYVGTVGCAAGAGLTASAMILFEDGDAWRLFAVLLILMLLGFLLTPVAHRLVASPKTARA